MRNPVTIRGGLSTSGTAVNAEALKLIAALLG